MFNRSFLKSAAAQWAGERAPPPGGDLAVLTYHSVGTGAPGSIDPTRFTKHLQAVHQAGGVEYLDWRQRDESKRSGRACLVTFDDGYLDNFTEAAPVLNDQDVKALFFVTTGFLEKQVDITTSFKNYRGLPPMNWDHVGKLVERGHAIGLHGHTHRDFAKMSKAEARDELSASTDLFRRRLGFDADSFAYPFGQFQNRRTDFALLAAENGLRYIFTTDHRLARLDVVFSSKRPVQIPRLRADAQDAPEIILQKIRGAWDYVSDIQRIKSCAAMRSFAPLLQHDR